jgi:hypothetical protein
MDRLRMLTVIVGVTFAVACVWTERAVAQIRVQDTPAINGLGAFFFKDVSIQLDAGYGNDSPIRSGDEEAATRATAGIYVDKPFLSYLFDIYYDRDHYLGAKWERDHPVRDFVIEPLRFVAHYRVGNFAVLRGSSIKEYNNEFYVGVRYKLDLDRLFRHVPVFQK